MELFPYILKVSTVSKLSVDCFRVCESYKRMTLIFMNYHFYMLHYKNNLFLLYLVILLFFFINSILHTADD